MPFGVVSEPGAIESLAANTGSVSMARRAKRNGIGRPPPAKCREGGIPFTLGQFSYDRAFDVETCRPSSVRGVCGAVPDGEPRRLSRLFSGRRDRQPELDA